MKHLAAACLVLLLLTNTVCAVGPARVFSDGQVPGDRRLQPARTLRDGYHSWVPPTTRRGWERSARIIRNQLKVSNGLWPAWPRGPIKPVIHGKIQRDGYTVEKVFFASLPGHYVTGSLYRPSQAKGRRPGILCPHGHWANGRFYDAGAEKAASQIKKGAETFTAGARYPLQARMVQLARMGCVVFHYDMVGYADSGPLPHRSGFGDVQAVLRLQNLMGLQTFNSIRAIDFLETLPDVDPKRIAVTGASGGGTQTFMLCALDPRPRVAFPAVMVSTAMQGGCVCENCCYLRPGINNIAIAALFAPKPMALSGADDWTIDIETKGLPELKSVYGLFGKADLVQAKCYPQFGHNYNQVSREMMYGWMNEHLTLGLDQPIRERDFQPVAPAKLSVFDAEHPRPRDALTLEQYRVHQDGLAQQQFSELLEAAEAGKPSKKRGLAAYRRVVGVAAEVLLGSAREGTPKLNRVAKGRLAGGGRYETGTLTASGRGETIPWTLLKSDRKFSGSLVVWFDGRGKASLFDSADVPVKAVARLLEAGHAVLSADVFLTGELVPAGKPVTSVATHGSFVGYTYGYNLPPLAHRVQDVLTTVAAHAQKLDSRRVHLVGTRGAGTWVLLARAVASTGKKSRGLTIADIGGFGFSRITKRSDPMLLPGALKYGGLGGLTALAAPSRLLVAGTRGTPKTELDPLRRIYAVSAGRLVMQADPLEFEEVAALILDD